MTPVEIGRWSKPTFNRTYGINTATIKNTVKPEDMRPQPSEVFIEGAKLSTITPLKRLNPN